MRILVLCVILIFSASEVQALSCMPETLSQDRIADAEIIFEGKITALAPLARQDTRHMQKETFTVTKAYKGVQAGQQVDLYRNIYWGDGTETGSSHLVLSSQEDGAAYGLPGKAYLAPVCAHTQYFFLDDANKALLEP